MEKLTDTKSLLIIQLEWLLDAESIQLTEFPEIAMKISNDTMREIIERHTKKFEEKINRLEQAFYLLHAPIRRRPCNAMDALLDEAHELIDCSFTHEVLDAGLLACFQKIKLYEISAYGAACSYASTLHEQRIANLLHENLDTEKLVDRTLTRLAEATINAKAVIPHEEIFIW